METAKLTVNMNTKKRNYLVYTERQLRKRNEKRVGTSALQSDFFAFVCFLKQKTKRKKNVISQLIRL